MISLSLSAYRVFATHMATGRQAVFEVTAMDGGEALEKVECQCVWAADNFELIDPTECMDTEEYLAAIRRGEV